LCSWATAGSAGIAKALEERQIPFVVAEENRETVNRLRKRGQAAVYGNAVDPGVLVQAHIAEARMLVIATPETIEVRQMMQTAKALNPDIEIIVRSHNEEEAALVEREGAKVFVGERELARSMSDHVIDAVEQSHVSAETDSADLR